MKTIYKIESFVILYFKLMSIMYYGVNNWIVIFIEVAFIVSCYLNELSTFINLLGMMLTVLCGATFVLYCDMSGSQRGRDSLENLVTSTHFRLNKWWDKIIH